MRAASLCRLACALGSVFFTGVGVAAPAQRVVSLAPHLTELTFVAGAGDRLVGTVMHSDRPEAARAIPLVGDAFQVDLEKMLALKPDLVLAWETGTSNTLIDRLARLGIKVVTVATFNIEDVGNALRQIGRLAGTEATATKQATAFEQAIARERARYGNQAPISVFIEVDDRPLYTVNGRHLISQVVTLCGGRNIFAALEHVAPIVSLEAVIAADPEVILSTDDTDAQAMDLWNAWPRLQAVRSHTIHIVSADDLARPTPRLVDGIRAVCGLLEQARAARARKPQGTSG